MTQTDTPPRTTPPEDDQPSKRHRIELSAVQLVAGALAAMTAAVIGSRLGVSGTVLGAAVGSLVAGIAGSLYTASLQRGRQAITPLAAKAAPTLVVRPRPTAQLPTAAAVPPGVPTQATLAQGEGTPISTPRRRAWKPVLASAFAIFALAGLGITAIELTTGQALSGREGTTISQVGQGSAAGAPEQQPLNQPPAEEPTTEDEVTEEPSETPSETPTETPSDDPTDEGEPTEEPTETPSQAPTETPTETPSDDPTQTPSDDPTEDPTTSESPTPTP